MSLGRDERLFGGRWCTSVAYQQVITLIYFSALHNSTMDVGHHNVGARSIVLDPGNDGMGFGNSYMRIYREFGLGNLELAIVI